MAPGEPAARFLAAPGYLDLPMEWLLPSVLGRLRFEPRGPESMLKDFHLCADFLGRPSGADQTAALAQRTSRPDLFRAGARYLGFETPDTDRIQRAVAVPAPAGSRPV